MTIEEFGSMLNSRRITISLRPKIPMFAGVIRSLLISPFLRISTKSTIPNKPPWAIDKAIIPVKRKSV